MDLQEFLEEMEAGIERSLIENLDEVKENSYLLNLQHLYEKELERLEKDP